VRYANERFLYRLGESASRGRCVLKGASLLTFWLGDPYRATRDVDLLASGPRSEAAIRALIRDVCEVPCAEDGLRFDLTVLVVEGIGGADEYPGRRARLVAALGAARIQMQVDFGFDDVLAAGPDDIEYPVLLDNLPAPRVRAYPREAVMAEKFEAMVSLASRNSRMRDFHDVWALSEALRFDGLAVQRAVAACFERRRTSWLDELPGVLTPGFYRAPEMESRWHRHVAAGSVVVRPPNQVDIIGERIIQYFSPIRVSLIGGMTFTSIWEPRGPWR